MIKKKRGKKSHTVSDLTDNISERDFWLENRFFTNN